MPEIVDDKSEHCVPFILKRIREHQDAHSRAGGQAPPFFVGLNGVQGAGKTTLVTALKRTIREEHNLVPAVLSIDDLYLPHDQQEALAKSHPENPLVQHRGQPSTHDVKLGVEVFAALARREPDVRVPAYDKSAFNGAGDRVTSEEWDVVNRSGDPSIDVVIFEGWCVGFRALSDAEVERKWRAAKEEYEKNAGAYKGVLGRLALDSVLFVNEQLREYNALTDHFGAFIHIDAEDTQYVYNWRLQQEAAMRESKGRGMSDEQVIDFVNGYYPAYELYTDVLRQGIFPGAQEKQLRLVVGKDRRVKKVHPI